MGSATGGIATVGAFVGGGVRSGVDVRVAACVGVAATVAAAVDGAGVGCGWLQPNAPTRQQDKTPKNMRYRFILNGPESVGISTLVLPLIEIAAAPSVLPHTRVSICPWHTAALRP